MKFVLSFAAALLGSTAAMAATTSVSLQITGNNNVPTVTLTNTGDVGEISGFDITMGQPGYNFDGVQNEIATGGAIVTLLVGDTNTSGGSTAVGRYTTITHSATGFVQNATFSYGVDVDRDFANTIEDYQQRLLPGGEFVVRFSGGLVNSFTIDLTPTTGNSSEPYLYSASFSAAPVPLPAGLPLMLTALGGAAVFARRRRA